MWKGLIKNNDINGCREKLKRKEELEVLIDDFWTPLMYACQKGRVQIVKLLLPSVSSLDFQNKTGTSALMIACRYAHFEIVQLLVNQGADVSKAIELYPDISRKLRNLTAGSSNDLMMDSIRLIAVNKTDSKQQLLDKEEELRKSREELDKANSELNTSKDKIKELAAQVKDLKDKLLISGVRDLPQNPTAALIKQRDYVLELIAQYNDTVDNDPTLCKVCWDGQKEYTSGCGHLYCLACIKLCKSQHSGCYICKKSITDIIRIYK